MQKFPLHPSSPAIGLQAALAAVSLFVATTAMAAEFAPHLAPGVVPQSGYERPTETLFVANPTPIFSNIMWTSSTLGQLDRVGQKVEVVAKVRDWDWVLVGRGGVGIGYVPRDLLTATPRAGRLLPE